MLSVLLFGVSQTNTKTQVWFVWKSIAWQMSAICVEGTLLTIALTLDLLTALVKFQHRVGLTQAEVRRDEHFKHEKKILRFYIYVFIVCAIICSIIVIDRIIESYNGVDEHCNGFCQNMCYIEIVRDTILFLMLGIAVTRLFFHAKKRVNLLYKEYRVTCAFQSILILFSVCISIAVNLIKVLDMSQDTSKQLENTERYMLYTSLLLPPFMISMFPAKDLFSLFNKYPEQLMRVSSMQYSRINYNRFYETQEIFHIQENTLFGFGNKHS